MSWIKLIEMNTVVMLLSWPNTCHLFIYLDFNIYLTKGDTSSLLMHYLLYKQLFGNNTPKISFSQSTKPFKKTSHSFMQHLMHRENNFWNIRSQKRKFIKLNCTQLRSHRFNLVWHDSSTNKLHLVWLLSVMKVY